MQFIFLNEHGRLRSGWRAVVFLFFFLLAAGIFRTFEEIAVSALPVEVSNANLLFFTVNSIGLLVLALALGGVAGKLFESVPFRALGVSFTTGWLKHFLSGIAIGGLTLLIAVSIVLLFGGERFQLNPSDGWQTILASMGFSLVVFATGAAWEEAFFRGYILQTFTRSGLARLAIILTSAFFGLVHLGNRDATAISTLNTVLAGLVFSVAYFKTRDLWFVWGIHLMWNWMQGSFFGIEVSGLTNITTSPLLREIDYGPIWLTGQTYGIEGGAACTFALIVSMALIYFLPNPRPDKELLALSSPPVPESEPPAVAGG